jgi:serine/threonine protein kinase
MPRSITDALPVTKSLFVMKNQGKLSETYTFEKQLGQGNSIHNTTGSYGVVYRAIHKSTKEKRAIKLINKEKVLEGNEGGLFSEINVLKEMDHPVIMRVYEFGSEKGFYYLVTE